MFTGIIAGVGTVLKTEDQNNSRRLWIKAPFSLSKEKLGASIAVDGCCLTFIQKNKNQFAVDVSPETLQLTTLVGLQKNSRVNLELPITLNTRLGGHLVQGHVDAMGQILEIRQVKTQTNPFWMIQISYPKVYRKYLVPKGSITVDGISLTLNRITSKAFELCIIPHTQMLTTLTQKKVGDKVNLEFDLISKTLEQLLKR